MGCTRQQLVVEETIERREMLALRNEVESAGNHLEIHGGLNEGTGMKTFLLSPMFLAKALKLRFRVGELGPPPICLMHHDPTHGECAALSSQLCLTHVSPHHNPFGCFKDSPIRLSRLFRCRGPQRGLYSEHQGGSFRLPFGGSNLPKVLDYASIPSLELSARSQVLPASHRPQHYPTG